MTSKNHLITLALLGALSGLPLAAHAVQELQNGDFETLPVPAAAKQVFTNWPQVVGTEVSDAPVPIGGSHSILLSPTGGGAAYQLVSQTGNWQSDWQLDMDFACSDSSSATARSVNMNIYHSSMSYTNITGSSPNINFRVVDSQLAGFGDIQVYSGSAWVTVLTNVVSFSADQYTLQVNHLKIVGHYYANTTPNYDITLVNAAAATYSAPGLAYWQGGAPAAGSTNGQLYRLNLGTGSLAGGNWYEVDNVSLTVATVGQTAPSITVQPGPDQAVVYKGYSGSFAYTAQVAGSSPLLQWFLNGAPLAGATNNSLTVSGFSVAGTYTYCLQASNFLGSVVSSNVAITVTNAYQTGMLSNMWSLSPSNVDYLTTGYTERGFAYNRATGNLLLASRYETPADNVVVLDGSTGDFKYFLMMGNVQNDVPGSTLGLNQVGVADDGYVYGASVTVDAGSSSTPFWLWQWTDDGPNTQPASVFAGDPGLGTDAADLRWGDNLAVRGGGTNTEILVAPGSGTNVVMFTTVDGLNFVPNVLTISGAPSGFAQTGLGFGPGTNTFWAKMAGDNLYLVQFDLSSATGAVLYAYSSTNGVDDGFRNIGMDPDGHWLAGLASAYPDTVEIYSLENLSNQGPVLAGQELFPTSYANSQTVIGPVGSVAFGTNCLFVLDGNNGIEAYAIVPHLAPFSISLALRPDGLVLSWPSVASHSYQLQSRDTLTGHDWANVGAAITATGSVTSATNAVAGSMQFYRVQGR